MQTFDIPPAILVVEDHADTIKAMARLLRREGYVVTQARSKEEAIRHCKYSKFDLLISDVGLPDGDGYELMQEVTAKCKVPGIALTGYGYENDFVRTRAAGFAAHLVKPISFDELLKTIESVLAKIVV